MENENTEEVKQTTEQLKADNDALESEVARAERLRSVALMAGKSSGPNVKPEKKQISPQDYARAALGGKILKDD